MFHGINVGKYTSPIDPIRLEYVGSHVSFWYHQDLGNFWRDWCFRLTWYLQLMTFSMFWLQWLQNANLRVKHDTDICLSHLKPIFEEATTHMICQKGTRSYGGLCKLSSALREHPSSKNEPINNQTLYMLTQNRANKLIKPTKMEDSIPQSAHPKAVSFSICLS